MASQCGVWYPTVFPDRCDGCEGREVPRCIQFCPNDVYEIKNGKAVVARPYNCVNGCTACEPVCPKKAISFPQRATAFKPVKCGKKGLLHKVKCKVCGKVFWANWETDVCMECAGKK